MHGVPFLYPRFQGAANAHVTDNRVYLSKGKAQLWISFESQSSYRMKELMCLNKTAWQRSTVPCLPSNYFQAVLQEAGPNNLPALLLFPDVASGSRRGSNSGGLWHSNCPDIIELQHCASLQHEDCIVRISRAQNPAWHISFLVGSW